MCLRPLLLLCITLSVCRAQTPEDSIPVRPGVDLQRKLSILAGYNFWRNHYAELGVAINQYGRVGHHPAAWACFVSNEMRIGDRLLMGPKVGAWIGGGAAGLALGINAIYYTDFDESSLRIRPEIGIGFDRWKVVYGYNLPLYNRNFDAVNRSTVSLTFLFGIKKLKTIRE